MLPEDIRHALEIRWEARLAFDLLAPESKRECIRWIEDATSGQPRHRRIDTVLDSLRPDGAGGPRARARSVPMPSWRSRAAAAEVARS
jgi:uncharacterized protein YdeI (YjbR/CyaY-like superfamily)